MKYKKIKFSLKEEDTYDVTCSECGYSEATIVEGRFHCPLCEESYSTRLEISDEDCKILSKHIEDEINREMITSLSKSLVGITKWKK